MAGFDELVDFFDSMQTNSPVRELHKSLFSIAEIQPGMRVADVGGGPSLLGRLAAGAGARAIEADISRPMLLRARERAQAAGLELRPLRGDALALPLRPGTLDRIFCTNLMFLMNDGIALLRELGRVLKPGGKILMLNPTRLMNPATMRARTQLMGWRAFDATAVLAWSRAAEVNHPYSKERLSRELRAAGLQVEVLVEEWDGMAILARARRAEGDAG